MEFQENSFAKVTVGTIVIPTYPEAKIEDLPMFSENRVHQRTSGRPYPNKVTLEVNRGEKIDKSYKLVTLENEYIKVEILPEIGGRIYSAYDKLTGYDFFYKQHVIKPALIGVLGNWISGGLEFNWPFHHRASGFMPCDYNVYTREDGAVVCALSEHDPIDRMKGMFSIILKPGERVFETKMDLYNRTANRKSFLWWENAAVPVNPDYQIFFPHDVSYVNFHYLKSRATYPIAGDTVFNGIPMPDARDISMHKNTYNATSYFASASDYDFFGGYDHGKKCGVVHIGDHHVSPGKKMFTWGYCQLAQSWERALTDTDGAYAELMAGSYSDNQPDFAWLDAYETKTFSQHWYPISEIGTPDFANLNMALRIDREANILYLQSTKAYNDANIKVTNGDNVLFETKLSLIPDKAYTFEIKDLPEFAEFEITSCGEEVGYYKEKKYDTFNMPDVIDDMPIAEQMDSADELYLAGVHVSQYRDPAVMGDAYWKEALKRNPKHVPSLIAMAEYEFERYSLNTAEKYAKKAVDELIRFNTRLESGRAYYIYAEIMEAKGDLKTASDYYHKAAWASDSVAKAMTKIAILDLKAGDKRQAKVHAETALIYGGKNNLASAALYLATGDKNVLTDALSRDPLDHLLRYLSENDGFYDKLESNPQETCLDIAFDLEAMGRDDLAFKVLAPLDTKMALYAKGYFAEKLGENGNTYYEKAESAELGLTYPMRREEMKILEKAGGKCAKMLLGCLLYNKRHYEDAAKLWETGDDLISKRNLAVAYFSHLGKADEALKIMLSILKANPDNEQLLYETVILMEKMNESPEDIIALITSHKYTRDDVITELSKAYNRALKYDKALDTLLSHDFTPCEGGEHAIADQFVFAHYALGRDLYNNGDIEGAIKHFREGQVLPDSLGAGLWNHCKLIPIRYFEALCMEKLGEKDKADEIFEYILNTKVEYFSNMHLIELPYYQALSAKKLGNDLRATSLITTYLRKWEKIEGVTDNGFFGTTPFFISFIDNPKDLRAARYNYLVGLCHSFMGEEKAKDELLKATKAYDNMYALSFAVQGEI